ncbi:hypothetical protein IAE16_05870 [Hydrogenobacter sp. T-2]|nr:hypothetical protein [Hydrogenobacter sp. T-2]WPM31349.1 hypothetical protein IAE16_05870 [Hydrogenobacter sp. T-2]
MNWKEKVEVRIGNGIIQTQEGLQLYQIGVRDLLKKEQLTL